MTPVRFSKHYKVTRTKADDWFDPLLTEDTKLFVDPFLIYVDESTVWAGGHQRLMDFFGLVMDMLAESGFNERSNTFKLASGLLMFPEPPEFCLGVSEASVLGAGSAKGLQKGMLKGAAEAINLGIASVSHFEELALFGEQIGADRIGDMTCNVLKKDFIAYTQTIAKQRSIPLTSVNVKHMDWDATTRAWKDGLVDLPLNPFASKTAGHPVGVILVPKRFLRRLPTIDPQDFWDYAWTHESDQIRTEFNYQVAKNVDRAKIARLALRKHDVLKRYLATLDATPKAAYDVEGDPDLIVRPADFGKDIADAFASTPKPATKQDFEKFVRLLIENFKHCVEQRGAWELLWVNDMPRGERHVQRLFQTSAVLACQLHDVDISPESNAGRGPVDFKMSKGWKLRALVETKLAKSTSFWKNLKGQLPTYSAAEGCQQATSSSSSTPRRIARLTS
jgi:hypothetical protein